MIPTDIDHLRTSGFGRFAARSLNFLPSSMVVPVLSGPLRGMRWVLGSSVHSCWMGLYERDKLDRMREHIRPGDVVYDIGAQAGYHSLMAAKLVGEQGRVYSFEPLPRNAGFLTRHVSINGLRMVEIVNTAVSNQEGTVSFDPGPSFMAGRIANSGTIRVAAVALDSWRAQTSARPPSFLKIDVEGAERNVLTGGAETIRRFQPVIALDTHDFLGGDAAGIHDSCCQLLEQWGYQILTEPMQDPLFARHVLAIPK